MNKVESFQLSEGNKVSIDLGVCGYGFEGPATVIIVKEAANEAANEQVVVRGIIDSTPTIEHQSML